jgi:hypothetical protein
MIVDLNSNPVVGEKLQQSTGMSKFGEADVKAMERLLDSLRERTSLEAAIKGKERESDDKADEGTVKPDTRETASYSGGEAGEKLS